MKKDVNKEISNKNPWYVQEQFDSLPHQKRTIKSRWEFINKIYLSYIAENKNKQLRILDAGCGDGVNLKPLSKIPNSTVYACDYNQLRLSRAKNKYPDVRFFQQDLTKDIKETGFDIILFSQVIEHIPDDKTALEKLIHALKPDGILILGTPNEGCFLAWLRNHIIERKILRTTDHIHFYTENQLMKIFDKKNVYVTDKIYESFFIPSQFVSRIFARTDIGYKFLSFMHKIFPSQAGGYYFALKKHK